MSLELCFKDTASSSESENLYTHQLGRERDGSIWGWGGKDSLLDLDLDGMVKSKVPYVY